MSSAARSPKYCVAGVGFRRATSADEIAALIHRALVMSGLALGRLATAADRAHEPAIRAVAEALAVPLVAVTADALVAVDGRVVTRSTRIETTRRVGSVAEAAALAVAGLHATIVLPRIASAGATCALALGPQSVTQAT